MVLKRLGLEAMVAGIPTPVVWASPAVEHPAACGPAQGQVVP